MELLNLFEPEETVGNAWHDIASRIASDQRFEQAAIQLPQIRTSLAVLFRALGGAAGVDIAEAPASKALHRTRLRLAFGSGGETVTSATYDGERLRLPPVIDCFADPSLNKAAYMWLTASAALTDVSQLDLPMADQARDCAQIRANIQASDRVFKNCPGLREVYGHLCSGILEQRVTATLPPAEAAMERAVRDQLNGSAAPIEISATSRGYRPFAPVPIWLDFRPTVASKHNPDAAQEKSSAPGVPTTTRKMGERRDLDQANRKDSFIVHRFESILSWVESMNINRSVDDDDDENAKKAAEDQDSVTLSRHDRKAATRLRLHLDLSPIEAEHERLAGKFTYPEWNHRSRSYMQDHVRVLEAPVQSDANNKFTPDPRRIAEVRRQFVALRPRRILTPRQIDGQELDLDAVIAARADLQATGRGSDRIYMASRQIERDLSVAVLMDTSRSTEAAIGETCVIDVARDALAALATGIDASGDRLGIWGFSSLKRNRVFLSKCKGFDDPMSAKVTENICALRPGHYTRLGAAIRHSAMRLADESSSRRLLLVLTDGKPNDLDHYEGQHGIEDSHMAVREARRMGLTVHGIVVDEDGQDWFARIFGKGGFTLLPNPNRLTRALPEIYRVLTQET
ncbi:MAG: nitric oxide reductase activation protein NorD [Cognatishimia sp.]